MTRDPRTSEGALEKIRRLERAVEQEIRDAIERGELSGLPGEGRPLPADPDEGLGERWAAAHIVRDASLAPEWAALRREIDEERRRLVRRLARHGEWLAARRAELARIPADRILEHDRATVAAADRVDAELAGALAALNAKVTRYNLLVRVAALQLVPLTRERLAALAAEEAR